MSRVMLLMRLVSLSPYFLSFVPSPGSSLHCKTSRSGHSGGGGEGTSHWKGMVVVWKPVGNQRKSLERAGI